MTRINVVDTSLLADQHLMAEYRELPMVMAASRKSNPAIYKVSTAYTLNTGHVRFFYSKKAWLMRRWDQLTEELFDRKYQINPESRRIDFSPLDRFPQIEWEADDAAVIVNLQRIHEKIMIRPTWYKFRREPFCGTTIQVDM